MISQAEMLNIAAEPVGKYPLVLCCAASWEKRDRKALICDHLKFAGVEVTYRTTFSPQKSKLALSPERA